MKRRRGAGALILLITALFVALSFLLPKAVMSIADRRQRNNMEYRPMDEVTLSTYSVLTPFEKLAHFRVDTAITLENGRTLNAETAGQTATGLLKIMGIYVKQLKVNGLSPIATPLLVLDGEYSMLVWRVDYTGDGRGVTVYFDEETGVMLGLRISGDSLLYDIVGKAASEIWQWKSADKAYKDSLKKGSESPAADDAAEDAEQISDIFLELGELPEWWMSISMTFLNPVWSQSIGVSIDDVVMSNAADGYAASLVLNAVTLEETEWGTVVEVGDPYDSLNIRMRYDPGTGTLSINL